jgi:hypothetical protein
MPANWTKRQFGEATVMEGQFVDANKLIDEMLAEAAVNLNRPHIAQLDSPAATAKHFADRYATGGGNLHHTLLGMGIDHEPSIWPPPNLILSTRAKTQAEVDANVPPLLECPAACRALDLEPVEGLDMSQWFRRSRLKTCIKGGRDYRYQCYIHWLRLTYNGSNADHIADLIEQADAAGVPVWVEGKTLPKICEGAHMTCEGKALYHAPLLVPAHIRRNDLPGMLKGESKCG